MGILDEFPYPWGKPMAQELMRVMAGLYRTQREAELLTATFGIDTLEIKPGLSPIELWYELLNMLAARGKVRETVQTARDRVPGNPRLSFLDALLADRTAPISAEPLGERGHPSFDDSVTVPEALLFFDDLTMPIGEVPNLVGTLNRMVAVAPAICLLRVQNVFGDYFGTGFRIGPDLVLTNHHVLFPRNTVAAKVQVDFGFESDTRGNSMPVTSLSGKVESIIGEKNDDWAVVRIADMKPEWPTIAIDGGTAPKVNDLAYILQHPNAQQKRLGFVRNRITDVDDRIIRYLTDTEPGSSGAPVFDAQGRLLALHHAGGQPVEVAGKPPVSKNEGIRIGRVLARLRENNILL
jgi:V8-like Glu-specific endopeptidase